MEDISRAWWIGYICAYIVVFSALLLAAWYFMPRPEVPPLPPVAKVEVPPPPPPEPPAKFTFPIPPQEPAVADLLRRLDRALQAIPPCRIETSWVHRYFEGATPQDRRESGGRVLSDVSTVLHVEGDFFRRESHVRMAEHHPKTESPGKLKDTPYDAWELQNGHWVAEFDSGDLYIRATPLRVALQPWGSKSPSTLARLSNVFAPGWEYGDPADAVKLQWSVRNESSAAGELVLISGDPIPDSPDQHLRCELVLDPARDHLIVRESYWLNGELYSEETNELQQLPDGRWFPKRNVRRRGDTVSVTEYVKVEMDVDTDDRQFEMESIPCDLGKVLARVRPDYEGWNDEFMQFVDGFWKKVEPPKRGISTPNAKLEWAEPRE